MYKVTTYYMPQIMTRGREQLTQEKASHFVADPTLDLHVQFIRTNPFVK